MDTLKQSKPSHNVKNTHSHTEYANFSTRARSRMFINDVHSCIERMRQHNPLVHCITNTIVQELTASVLLASGASPIMVEDPQEARNLAQLASSLLVNVGTFRTGSTDASIHAALEGCTQAGTPWVLDPVGVGCNALTSRIQCIHSLINQYQPTVIRANASEILALDGKANATKGVDSHDDVDYALQSARMLSKYYGCTVAISGETDVIYSHGCVASIAGGSSIMSKVVGTGCSLGALVAAYIGTNPERPLAATVAAHAHAAAAGSWAAQQTSDPGTFRSLWIDGLSRLDATTITHLTKIEFSIEPVDWTLYLVTDPRMGNRSEESVAVESVDHGVSVVQLRDKYANDAEIAQKALRLRNALNRAHHGNVPIFIDDHVECASKLGFNLHIGQKDMPFTEARKRIPAEWLLGLSCARPDLMEKAYLECKQQNVPLPDVIGIGAAFATQTKEHDVPPLGIEGVNEVARVAHRYGVKTLAIGGIHENTVFPIRDLDIDGVCTVSALMCAEKPGEVAEYLKRVITQ